MTESAPKPPTARQDRHQTIHHDITLSDDYAWLREKENPDVTAYLEAENAYAEAVMAPLAGLREELYQEMLSHVKQTDVSVPYRDGAWWYYSAPRKACSTRFYCRKHGGSEPGRTPAPRKCCWMAMQLAQGHAVFRHRRHRHHRRRTLAGLHDRHDRLPAIHAAHQGSRDRRNAAWRSGAGGLRGRGPRTIARSFYTVEDEQQKRQFQLWRHTLGTSARRRRAGLSGRR